MMIAALSPGTKTVLRDLIWPLPFILTVVICAGILLLAARIARIESRSYLRAVIAVIICLLLGFAGQAAVISLIGKTNWVLIPMFQVCCFLPIPFVFRASCGKSLVAYVISQVMLAASIVIIFFLAKACGVRFPGV